MQPCGDILRSCQGSLLIASHLRLDHCEENGNRHIRNRRKRSTGFSNWRQYASKGSRFKETSTRQQNSDNDNPATQFQAEEEGSDTAVTRHMVLQACLRTSLWMTLIGLATRCAVSQLPESHSVLDTSVVSTLLQNNLDVWHTPTAILVAGAVTAGRLALLSLWPEYRIATAASNSLVLTPLEPQDVLLISFLPGFSEELLFRGAAVPALGARWPAVAAAGIAFGILHKGGGRNWAFALWATAVGWAYGAAYLYTSDLLVPAFAHSLSNVASAAIWLRRIDRQRIC